MLRIDASGRFMGRKPDSIRNMPGVGGRREVGRNESWWEAR